jgi:hypothetical protein
LLPFNFGSLYHLEANIEDQVGQKLQESSLELLILSDAVVQLKQLNNEIGDRLLLDGELKVRPLSEDHERLQDDWQQRVQSFHHLVIVLCHLVVTLFVLVLEDIVDAFESSSFQMVDLVVQALESSDADHSHVVGRVRNLNANRKDSDEDLSQWPAGHETNVAWIILRLLRKSLKDAKYHAHEGTEHLSLLQDADDLLVVRVELQLILLQHGVESEDVCVDAGHQVVHRLVQLLDADPDRKLVNVLIGQAKHCFGQHETGFHTFGQLAGGAVGDLLRDALQDLQDVVLQARGIVLLVSIQDQHLLVSRSDVELGLQIEIFGLKAFEEGVDVLQSFFDADLVVANRRDDSEQVLGVHGHRELHVFDLGALGVGEDLDQQSRVLQLVSLSYRMENIRLSQN